MKNLRHSLPLSLLIFLSVATLTSAASAPAMEVTVSNSAGKLVYNGKIDAKGIFATPNLAPGSYVVQFNARNSIKGGPFALVVSAGKKKVVAESVPAGKFSKGGVAMKVDVAREINLTGQVADAGAATADTKSNSKVKYIKGKKYVWVTGDLGSNLGGRWVDASSAGARNSQNIDQDGIRAFQDRTQPPPPPNGR